MATVLATLGRSLITLKSNIWSHWYQPTHERTIGRLVTDLISFFYRSNLNGGPCEGKEWGWGVWISQPEFIWDIFLELSDSVAREHLLLGSGFGSAGNAVASDIRGPQFESSHQQNYIEQCLLSTILKRRK